MFTMLPITAGRFLRHFQRQQQRTPTKNTLLTFSFTICMLCTLDNGVNAIKTFL